MRSAQDCGGICSGGREEPSSACTPFCWPKCMQRRILHPLPPVAHHPQSKVIMTRAGQVIAAEVLKGATFIAGEQRVLFTSTEIIGTDVSWDLAPDGEHFVVMRCRGLGAEGELVLVDNVTTELREKVK